MCLSTKNPSTLVSPVVKCGRQRGTCEMYRSNSSTVASTNSSRFRSLVTGGLSTPMLLKITSKRRCWMSGWWTIMRTNASSAIHVVRVPIIQQFCLGLFVDNVFDVGPDEDTNCKLHQSNRTCWHFRLVVFRACMTLTWPWFMTRWPQTSKQMYVLDTTYKNRGA